MMAPVIRRLCFASVVVLVACATRSGRPTEPRVSRAGIATGETLVVLDEGDFVYPRFSPDGDRLAFAQVLLEDDFQNTQVLVLNLASGTVDTLLPASAARSYGLYASVVVGLSWPGADQLVAEIHDGDVASTIVTLDVNGGAIRGEERVEPGVEALPPRLETTLARLHELYPGMHPSDNTFAGPLEHALRGDAILVSDTAVILQLNYTGYDPDIWYYSLRDSLRFRILDLPERASFSFGGGVVVGGAVAFAVRIDDEAHVFVFDGDPPPTLVARAHLTEGTPLVSVRHASQRGAWFLTRAQPTHGRGHNPAFFFDGSEVHTVGDFDELYDLDVHPGARRVAFSYWIDATRNIAVKELVVR